MKGPLAGKTALVTGAARGIGRACALELATQGADVVLNDLANDEMLRSLAADIQKMGRRTHMACADVADPDAVMRMFARMAEDFGPINILVNNAAWSTRRPFLETPLEEARRAMEVSFWGSFYCSRLAAEQMANHNGGSIVMISSVHAVRPYPNAAAYNAAKAALDHLAASMALELAPHRIRVNVVAPGWIDTPGERGHNTEQQIQAREPGLPLGRLGKAEEVASAVAYLCSPNAAYVTGSTLRVDGGFALRF